MRSEKKDQPEQVPAGQPVLPAVIVEQATEEVETLHASIKVGTVAQIVVALIAIIGLLYLLKLVWVTILVSVLLASVLEPAVAVLVRWHCPRWASAMGITTMAVILSLGLFYFSYNRAVDFLSNLPRYSAELRRSVGGVRARADKILNQASSVVEPPKQQQKPIPVRIEQAQGITQILSETSSTVFDVLMAVSFVPFLVYFMLASKEHVYASTVRLFPREHRLEAHRTVGTISTMIRSYVLANVIIGLVGSVVCGIVFWYLGIPYFYFMSLISGFVTLVPYLGVFLALLPPLAGGIGTLHLGGIITVIVTVIAIHLVTMNLLYPRVIGPRLQLNALAVSLSLLFWAWIWGALGLLLAIPILGVVKILCDHVEPLQPLGSWLGT
ncbi:MAG TPA: AI-2E family transporter [Candidatus Sulfotelmatobacter sp.]|nr:AI-2E family transporter [Candidatus Sulfotelmatobacter sp.]